MSSGHSAGAVDFATARDLEPATPTGGVDASILEAFEKDIKDFLLPDNKASELELKLFDVNEEDELTAMEMVGNGPTQSSNSSSGFSSLFHTNRRSQTHYSHSNNTSIDTFITDPSSRYRGGSVSSNNGAPDLEDSRYRSMRSSASSLASNRSDKMHSLAAKLEQLSHAVSPKDRSPKSNNRMSGEGDVTLQAGTNGYSHNRTGSHASGNLSPHSSSPNHQPRAGKTLSRISSDLEQRLRRSRQQFRQRSAATLRLSTIGGGISNSGSATGGISSPTVSEFGIGRRRNRVSDYINFLPMLPHVVQEIVVPEIPQDDSALPLWFLRQVLRSNQSPGAHITDHLFLPSDLWTVTKINSKLLATRLKCLDDLTRLGSEFIRGEVTLATPQLNLADLEATFNTAFIIPLNESSAESASNSRSSSIAEGASDFHSPTSVYTTTPLAPSPDHNNGYNRLSLEKPKSERLKPRKSISTLTGTTLSPTSTSQSKMSNSGFSFSGSVFKRFRKKSVQELNAPSSGTISPTESITMLGPDEAAMRIPMLASPLSPALTLHNYLSSISSLTACLKSLDEILEQKSVSTGDGEQDDHHPVDIEEQKYTQNWVNQFRSFVARVACRLILKDIVILQDVYKSDFKGFLLS
jgi:hypothetical protein